MTIKEEIEKKLLKTPITFDDVKGYIRDATIQAYLNNSDEILSNIRFQIFFVDTADMSHSNTKKLTTTIWIPKRAQCSSSELIEWMKEQGFVCDTMGHFHINF